MMHEACTSLYTGQTRDHCAYAVRCTRESGHRGACYYPARPMVSPFVANAIAGRLPASDRTGLVRLYR